jgi:hypothetical protein
MTNTVYFIQSRAVRRCLSQSRITPSSFKINGIDIKAQAIDLTRAIFKNAGINPAFFMPGARLFLLDPIQYDNFCKVTDLSSKEKNGFYPLSKKGEEKKVMLGELDYLSNPSRTVVLPSDCKKADLMHELAHDIFLGGGISKEDREAFFKLAICEARRVLNTAPGSQEAYFIRRVSNSGRKRFNLKELISIKELSSLTYEQRVFAGELFAYAIEMKITKDRSLGKIPAEIDIYIEENKFVRRRFFSIF